MVEEKKEEMLENISDENAEDVSGGAIFHAGRHAGDQKHKWEVIDDKTGKVLGRYGSKKQALAEAKSKGSSTVRYYLMSSIKKKRDAWNQHTTYDLKWFNQSDDDFNNPF